MGNITTTLPRRVELYSSDRQLNWATSPHSDFEPAHNNLTGEIPAALGALTNLTLALYSNTLGSPGTGQHYHNSADVEPLLTGTIPSELGQLSMLTRLDLSNNRLTDTIPASLANLSTTLRYLRLHNNQLRGQITTSLNVLTNLEEFTISGNNAISGCIPPSLWSTITVEDKRRIPSGWRGCCAGSQTVRSVDNTEPLVYASGRAHSGMVNDCNVLLDAKNTLQGTASLNWDTTEPITAWQGIALGTMPYTSVQTLSISNTLSGEIPSQLGNLAQLRALELYSNTLTGTIPSELGQLSMLTRLDLSNNRLTDTIPASLANLSTTLRYLRLHNNQLRGQITTSLNVLTNLEEFTISGNNAISGCIPPSLWSTITVEDKRRIPSGWRGCCAGSQTVRSVDNTEPLVYASGRAHSGMVNDCNVLLDAKNTLQGTASLNWDTTEPITAWQGIALGTMPYTSVQTLSISNTLSGEIPSQLGNLAQLRALELYSNTLTGTIPSELGNLANLQTLALYSNTLTGRIPAELGSLSALTKLQLHSNSLTGPIPSELGDLASLEWLYLNNNRLTGPIPSELGDLTSLTHLYLKQKAGQPNQLSGCIPNDLDPDSRSFTGGTDLSDLVLDPCPAPAIPQQPSPSGGSGGGGGGGSTQRPTCTNGTVVPNPSANADLVRDCVQLLTIKATLEGSISTSMRLNWSENSSIDTWEGVTISGVPQRVIRLELDISGKTLAGSIPSTLSRLTGLQTLNISNNEFSGRIPVGLRALATLQVLDFSNNRLSGSMPTDLGNIATLQTLHLANNSLTGSIPTTLVDLSALRSLSLAGNRFSGCIPNALTRVAQNDLSAIELSFCDPVTPTATPTTTPTATATPLAPVGQDLFLPLVRK